MNIQVKAKPSSKKAYVKQVNDTEYIVAVHEPPIDGAANVAITKALADYFSVKASEVILVSGRTSRQKIFTLPSSAKSPKLF